MRGGFPTAARRTVSREDHVHEAPQRGRHDRHGIDREIATFEIVHAAHEQQTHRAERSVIAARTFLGRRRWRTQGLGGIPAVVNAVLQSRISLVFPLHVFGVREDGAISREEAQPRTLPDVP